ncbi:MAG: nucleoside-diphosphate-sugar epimerase [Sulfitobacter sp.]|jgi:nucleoside-diphosphate-sugar epimerase
MKIVILGAGGMLGAKLAARLADGALGEVNLTLIDRVAPQGPDSAVKIQLDLAAQNAMQTVADLKPDLVYHLAAVVSGQAEAEFDTGYSANLDLTRALAEAMRGLGTNPRLIFSSSLAVYGPPFLMPVPDDFRPTPASSYGTQKAMAELMLADYTRKGFLRAQSLRLPTVSIRPGLPNAAASGFLSGILREPLHRKSATLPVAERTPVWIASPDITVSGLIHAASLSWGQVNDLNPLNLCGISVTVAEMLAALSRLAGPDVRALVTSKPDEAVARIVTSWPQAFDTARAEALGFPVNTGIDQIIAEYCGQFAPDALRT